MTHIIREQNPFLHPFGTPHQAVPFQQIQLEHYLPAFKAAILQARDEEQHIASSPEPPSFTNTIEALENSGQALNRVAGVFFNLLECQGTDQMMALAEEVQPLLSEHTNQLMMNEPLFHRVEQVWLLYHAEADTAAHEAVRSAQPLTEEQEMLLEETYRMFESGGARLQGASREEWRQVAADLDRLTLLFGQNVLKATQDFSLLLTDSSQLAGLPDFVVETLAADAAARGQEGWLVTLQAPSYRPFMTYSAVRPLREQLYRAYGSRATAGTAQSNDHVIRDIVRLRLRKAQLLGYETYADYRLRSTMASDTAHVMDLLHRLLTAYKPVAEREMEELRAYAREHEGADFNLQAWDLSYYSNLLKKERYDVDDTLLKPYFPLTQAIEGVFTLAGRLYGLTFNERPDLPKYHPDVTVYEVQGAEGEYLGLFYADFFAREGKQQGAWMTAFKEQWVETDGHDSRPHISIVTNFTRPTEATPSLLTYDEVRTLLHEFGHALHGLLTRCNYQSLSGTNVPRDFVELPSQFMENFLDQREFLDIFARHYQTGEAIPQALVDRILRARNFQAGYLCVRQLSFGLLDMAYHTLRTPIDEAQSLADFEAEATRPTQLYAPVAGTMTSNSFTHIFSGGYAAGYYGYKWAEVLDADAFSLFEERGIWDAATARAFRTLLERGHSRRPEVLYREFRGRDPQIEALMRRDGILA
jgi:peptidyl-dipeptidase Dcp